MAPCFEVSVRCLLNPTYRFMKGRLAKLSSKLLRDVTIEHSLVDETSRRNTRASFNGSTHFLGVWTRTVPIYLTYCAGDKPALGLATWCYFNRWRKV